MDETPKEKILRKYACGIPPPTQSMLYVGQRAGTNTTIFVLPLSETRINSSFNPFCTVTVTLGRSVSSTTITVFKCILVQLEQRIEINVRR